MRALAHNNMVVHGNAKQRRGADDVLREVYVFLRGGRVARRVVVHQNNGCRFGRLAA